MRISARMRRAVAVVRWPVFALLVIGLVFGVLGVSFSADTVIATVPVQGRPQAIAVNPVSNLVYCSNYESDTVSVIDGASHLVTATVAMPPAPTAQFPIAVVTDPTRGLAYVANFWGGAVAQISEPGLSVTATMPDAITHNGNPRALALDPGSTPPKLYVANYGQNSVTVLNALTMARITEIPVGQSPRALAIFTSVGRRRVFVGNRYTNNVTIIDGATDSVVGTVALDGPPKAIAVNGTGGKAYVTVPSTNKVYVIGTTDSVVATIGVGGNPVGIDFRSPQYGLVACYVGNEADVIDATTDTLVTTVPVGPGPFLVAASPLDAKWYVTSRLGGVVDVVSATYTVTAVTVGATPYQVAVNEASLPHKAFCTNSASNTVSVIDEPLLVGASPFTVLPAMAAGSATQRLAITIDPIAGDTTMSTTPVLTGSVVGTTTPFEFAISAVWYRLDSETGWRRADIVQGAGTSSVRWSASLGPLGYGPHTVRVMAMDEGMASAVSAADDGGAAAQTPEVSGAYAFTVEAPLTYVEETDPAIAWGGTWYSMARSLFSGGIARYTMGGGRTVTVPFQGTGIDWIGAKSTSGGMSYVYLDGVYVGTVDQYSWVNQYRQTLFSSGALVPGSHVLQVRSLLAKNPRSSGYTCWVDAFRVTGTVP